MFNFIKLFVFSDKLTCLPINLGRRTSYINWCIFYLVIKSRDSRNAEISSSSEFCNSKVQCGEPEVNLYSPQDNSFGTPARKAKKRMISSSTISSPDASCSAWFSVDHGNEPECVYKNDNNSTKPLTNECVTNEPEINK